MHQIMRSIITARKVLQPRSVTKISDIRGQQTITLTGSDLTPERVFLLGRFTDSPDEAVKIKISDAALPKVARSRSFLEEEARLRVIYGVNTGFGFNHDKQVTAQDLSALQVNLIRSHSSGVGNPIPNSDVRMMLAMRINSIIKGYSGVSKDTVEKMVNAFNVCCLPQIPEQGTVGASGDLAPLAHMMLGLMGEGKMWSPKTGVADAAHVLKAYNLSPISLGMKEGLACVNGTQFICAKGVEALVRAKALARQADVVTALTVECLKGTKKAFDPRVHAVKPHSGQSQVARRIYKLLDLKKITNASETTENVQDAYCLRCAPQVHGIVHDTLNFVENILTTEINSVTDNPLYHGWKKIHSSNVIQLHVIKQLVDSREVLSGGNFHGQYPAMALDFLAICVNELANISERRIDRLVNKNSSKGLSAFLVPNPGLNSGFMIPQYVAASLVSEGKVLSHPACVDSIPTCGGYEDHVSMGGFSARKAVQIVSNAEKVLGIELLTACQAVDMRKAQAEKDDGSFILCEPLEGIHELVRKQVPFMTEDFYIAPHIDTAVTLLREEKVWEIVGRHLE